MREFAGAVSLKFIRRADSFAAVFRLNKKTLNAANIAKLAVKFTLPGVARKFALMQILSPLNLTAGFKISSLPSAKFLKIALAKFALLSLRDFRLAAANLTLKKAKFYA
ncbi:hypothetical protein [uncultured Campylobacter sp.]|uniref:hypothetical protein n=1 Tax=uncultured Campylobacter sp. TaxID=218934 RepID=UPI002626EF4E|nr:hypothetical protein [uncultured Campylobacter sp.]